MPCQSRPSPTTNPDLSGGNNVNNVTTPDALFQPRRTGCRRQANTRYLTSDAVPEPAQPAPRRRRHQPAPGIEPTTGPAAPNTYVFNTNVPPPPSIPPTDLDPLGQHLVNVPEPPLNMPVIEDDIFNQGSTPNVQNEAPFQQPLSLSISTSSGEIFPSSTPSSSVQSQGPPRSGPRGRQRHVATHQQHVAKPSVKLTTFLCGTGTSVLRNHLRDNHRDIWITSCDRLNISITAQAAQSAIRDYRARRGSQISNPANYNAPRAFTPDAFVDAIAEFIVADDQSINVIESPQLRAIFLMLREELHDSDIPHRTTIRNRVMQMWEEYLDTLHDEMQKAPGKISTTTDMWSDPNLTPYMAVTAHWIQVKLVQTPDGPQHILTLRADLIGFFRVPGRHDGDHLSQAFLFITDRIGITHKLGWVTLDNASNNDTFMTSLEVELHRRRIPFNKIKRRIRCFPHVVNLACKAIISAISSIRYPTLGMDQDPIIRASSIRRQYFAAITKSKIEEDLQLLRDVETRWSSTLLMIERALLLRHPIDTFLATNDFEDLRKYILNPCNWEALECFKKILSVPHAFQQKLSAEKTPTLCDAIPSFEAMMVVWEKQKQDYPELEFAIQEGLNKLHDYRDRLDSVPAYVISMLINPRIKLQWFNRHAPHRIQEVKALFIQELRLYRITATINTPARPQNKPHESSDTWADILLGIDAPQYQDQAQTLESEVDAYMLDTQVGTSVISYWQENQLRYPTIFSLALDVLPIQGSAVPCERVFSSGKETMTARRNNINPDLMEALQILKFAFKGGRSLDFTAGTRKEAELEALLCEMEEETSVPEDIAGFIQTLVDRELHDSHL